MPKHFKKEQPSIKTERISCANCILESFCSGYMPDEECFKGKKTTKMEEKIRQRERIANFRRKVAKEYPWL